MENCRECKNNYPCLSCAEIILHGKAGPGYEFGRRIIYHNVSENIYNRMLNWMEKNPSVEVIDLKNQK